ncbi:transglycosylase SLT domain-containing protein [Falsarthrobacter nasiphocae]|uniref:Soluble lytic murein transglycosylase-like protein n=1 Tax=Falsarthrobacter nasiphocae TaxID=189863 RepID=A0AAE3YEP6_9MICC|nr:transglycosylase SLT domain-containing protein [Falsarthrobacter nasiphocae]MDR6891332.1 soluble lytic murein transglycosylase-like protein [Falsarthrobacter nasiphocae]
MTNTLARRRPAGARRIVGPAVAAPAIAALASVALAQTASAASTYTVKQGDTLSGIAQSNGVSLQNLISINRITNPNLLFPGQTLSLSRQAAAAPKPAVKPAATKTPASTAAVTVSKQYVDPKAPYQTWRVWDAAKNEHFIQATGAQANVYINVFVATGSKSAARAAAKLGQPAPTATAPVKTPAPVTTPAPTTAPAATKAWVPANAPFQTWKVWNAAGEAHYMSGTGKQANAYINVYLATGDKAAARAAALRLGPLTAPAATTVPAAPSTPAAPAQGGSTVSSNLPVGSVQALVAQIARQYGVDPALALAFAEQESGFQTNAVSSVGALGVMQIMPANQAWVSGLAGRQLNLYNTVDNITAGVVMIKYLLATSSSRDNAIASYYQGQGAVQMYGWYEDTKRYVAGINSRYARYAV